MSDFLEYYKKAEQSKAMTEEERFELHKKHKQFEKNRYDDDDEFYEAREISEGKRIYKQPVKLPAGMTQSVPSSQNRQYADEQVPVQKKPVPVKHNFDNGERTSVKHSSMPPVQDLDFNPYDVQQPVQKKQMPNPVSANPALKEAYQLMSGMQKKIETLFYRYGMAGLEKINERMDDIFENIVNPKQAVVISEPRLAEKTAQAAIAKPKKTIKKTTKVVSSRTEAKTTPAVKPVKSHSEDNIQQTLESMNNQLNVEQIGMLAADLDGANEESIAAKTMKRVQAQAAMLEQSIKNDDEPAEVESTKEDDQPGEELEIIDDDVKSDTGEIQIDMTQTESLETEK